MPEIPSGHVDKIKIQVLRNPQTEVNYVESGKLDWMGNEVPPDRYQDVKSKYEGSQFRIEPTFSNYFFWMNTTQAPFNDVKVRQAVNYAIDPRALERIYSGTPRRRPADPAARHARLQEARTSTRTTSKKAKELIAEANPSDKEITVWTDNEQPSDDAGAYYQGVLKELGFNVDTESPLAGQLLHRDRQLLDAGTRHRLGQLVPRDTRARTASSQPLLAEESIAPTNGTNLPRFADPTLSKKIAELGEEAVGPQQEAEYAQLDKEFMEEAPMAPYGTSTASTFVSSDINLENVVFTPSFGQDLASFEFK